MSRNLVVQSNISNTPQVVEDQSGNASAFRLATDQVTVAGKDEVGGSLPILVVGMTSSEEFDDGKTWGRTLRLQDSGTTNNFYDFGIDQDGNLFLNSKNSTQSNPVLTITERGEIILNAAAGLKFVGLQELSGSEVVHLVVDKSTGEVGSH